MVARQDRPVLADHLAAKGDLDNDGRVAVEIMVALQLKKHESDPEKSLASIPGSRSVRERLAELGDAELTGTVFGLASVPAGADSDRTRTFSVGSATSDGQRFRILRPHARGGLRGLRRSRFRAQPRGRARSRYSTITLTIPIAGPDSFWKQKSPVDSSIRGLFRSMASGHSATAGHTTPCASFGARA